MALRPSQESIIKLDAELLKGFLEPLESLLPHEGGEADAPLRPYDCRPMVLDHARHVALFHARDRVADPLLQLLGGDRRLQNRIKDALMQEIHDLPLFPAKVSRVHDVIFSFAGERGLQLFMPAR